MADDDSGAIIKQEEDYTADVDQALPQASSLAQVTPALLSVCLCRSVRTVSRVCMLLNAVEREGEREDEEERGENLAAAVMPSL